MKVWELIAKLSDFPAGTDVYVTDKPDGWINDIICVEHDEGFVAIKGDGRSTAENEAEDAA
jgi:hypothetical protein